MTTPVVDVSRTEGDRRQRRDARHLRRLVVTGGVLCVLFVVSIALGTRGVGWADIAGALFGTGGGDELGRAAVDKRLPRTVLAVLVGAALAVSGATMQAITRNPLAEPGLLGVSSGAALAVVVGVAFFSISDPFAYMGLAVAGAGITAVVVHLVGSLGPGGASPLALAIAGAAVAAACSSLVGAILLPRIDVMSSFRFWQIGGVGGATWDRIVVATPFLAAGFLGCMANARGMNALALGDGPAAGLGATVARTRLAAAAGAVVLAGVATSIAGPIGFVGLVVPHVCRATVGTDHRRLLPLAALGGAVLLVAADVLGRIVARPEEVDVGIVTAVIGAPVLLRVAGRPKPASL